MPGMGTCWGFQRPLQQQVFCLEPRAEPLSLPSRLPCQEERVRQQYLQQRGHLREPVGRVQLRVSSGLRGQELCPG